MTVEARISPFLWFDNRAEEAVDFYVAIFPGSSVTSVMKIPDGPLEGNALIEFELGGQRFTAIDGGPMFQFSPAISLVVSCDSQEEIDYFAGRLSEGGSEDVGWVFDKFGVSWQVQPSLAIMSDLMERAPKAVMRALLSMTRIDLEGLRQAAAQGDGG